MPNWLAVVLVVVAVLAAGLFRERWRLRAMERWCRQRGFRVMTPFVPGETPPVAALVKRFDVRGGRLWGAAVAGPCEGIDVTLAEHETSPPGKKTGVWQTIVAWPISGSAAGPLVFWPGARGAVASALAGVLGESTMRVDDRLGMTVPEPSSLRATTEGGLLVEGTAETRDAWLTDARRRALEAWPHGGAFAIDHGWAAWRVGGLLSVGRLEELLTRIPEARRLLG